MNLETLTIDMAELFRSNLEEFFEDVETATLTEAISMRMSQRTQELIRTIGVRTLEQFFESYDVDRNTMELEGAVYRLKYKGPRDFITSLGKIRINRNVFQKDAGGKSLVPLDRMWNMEHEYMSAEMKEGVLYACAHNTPEETAKMMAKFGLVSVHASSIKKVVDQVGMVMEQHRKQITDGIYQAESLPPECDIMACSLDGVNVLISEKGKRKGRPRERPHVDSNELSGSSFKNAMCGSISFYNTEYQEDKNEMRPNRLLSKYTSRMPEDHFSTFKEAFEKEIKHGMDSNPKVKIVLVDAHLSIQGYLRTNPLFKEFHCLIDFYHACEHLSKLAEWLFGKNSTAGQNWYQQKREILRTSERGVEKIIQSGKYFIEAKLTNQLKIRGANSELRYFCNHKKMMNYHDFVNKGWPIGSGVVEAACKSIVKQRMCRSGQRWTIRGGQHILNLRTIVKSNRWNQFYAELSKLNFKKCA
jgi:hypothetical protein